MFRVKSDQSQQPNKPNYSEGDQDSEHDENFSGHFVSGARPTEIRTDNALGDGNGDGDGIGNWDHEGQDHYYKVYNVEPMTER